MLSNGRGLSDVYKRLLDVVCVEGGDGVRGEGRRGQTQRQLEQYAKSCLLQSGVNVSAFAICCLHVPPPSFLPSLPIDPFYLSPLYSLPLSLPPRALWWREGPVMVED